MSEQQIRRRPPTSELYRYERYGYVGGQKDEHFEALDVTLCPRCEDRDIYPGDRVCSQCLSEINADDFS